MALLPIIGTAASLLGGFLDQSAAGKRADQAQRDLRGAQSGFLGSIDDIAKNTYKKSQEQKDLEALMTGTKGAGVNMDPIQAIQAQQLEAFGEGGERALMAGSQNLAKNVYDLTEAERDKTFGQEVAGRQSAATTAQAIADQNVGQKTMADKMRAGFYGDQFATAQQNLSAAESAKASAFPSAIGNALQFAGMFGGDSGGDSDGDSFASGGLIEEILSKRDIHKTGGEFNHDTNKKALVDEESGEKEAELTGGEYVLNPEQGEEIHAKYEGIEAKIQSGESVSEEEWMMFYEAVKSVFSQPQFNEQTA